MTSRGDISIWFFIGVSLVINGVLILGAGLYEFVRPPENPVVLYHLHANVWWGALLMIVGVIYCVRFAPTKEQPSQPAETRAREATHAR
jgi:hypothetical protein